MRLLCKHYHDYINSQVTRLTPARFDAEHMRVRFPDLVALDLSKCIQVRPPAAAAAAAAAAGPAPLVASRPGCSAGCSPAVPRR
jgi:hypothetical protein